jgi:hypothetical protein
MFQKDGEFMPDVLNARLCISTNQYVGNNNKFDDLVSGALSVTNAQEGQTIVMRTSRAVKYMNTDYFVRVGVFFLPFDRQDGTVIVSSIPATVLFSV